VREEIGSTLQMSSDLTNAILTNQPAFGLKLAEPTLARFEKYYQLLLVHNPILHLIGPMSTNEFAVRHILESLTLLRYFEKNARFADVGSGGGLPAIPCLLARDDLMAVLIESKEKKSKFLQSAVEELGIANRVQVATRQFQEVEPAGCQFVTCRALDRFTEKLDRLLKWSMKRQILLFGGPSIREALKRHKAPFNETLMPLSDQRYLFAVQQDRTYLTSKSYSRSRR
jgi:16S rRNA (guanine(527)-N(7))-methyltransferase RsmG